MQGFDAAVWRGDPAGLLVRFDAGSDLPIVRVDLDLEGDGEPAVTIRFDVGRGFDGRYVRALAFKPTVDGTWPLVVTAWDQAGRWHQTTCRPGVSVRSVQ